MMRRLRAVAVLVGAVVILLALANWPALGGGYTINVPDGVRYALTPDQIIERVKQRLADDSTAAASAGLKVVPTSIRSVVLVRASELSSVEPRAANVAAAPNVTDQSLFWVVRANGTFLVQRGRTVEDRVFDSGYLVFDDATGIILARGMP